MIEPSKINSVAKRYEDQNIKFRSYLKNRLDYDELDAQFLELHNELFANYDCCNCANCCKAYNIIFKKDEVTTIAQYLNKSEDDFINEYLTETTESAYDDDEDDEKEAYKTKTRPCPFLCADGKCKIQECKPSVCKKFPHTDQPDRLAGMLGILGFVEECPIVFEILERLKKLYGFRNRQ